MRKTKQLMPEKCGVCGGQLKNAVLSAGPDKHHAYTQIYTSTLKF